MVRLPLADDARVVHDSRSGAIRSWFKHDFRPAAKAETSPRAIARTVLEGSADLFRWDAALTDLADRSVVDAPTAHSVRFVQTYKELPVDESEIVVNIDDAGRLNSVYNGYHYDIPEKLDPSSAGVTAEAAVRTAEALFANYRDRTAEQPELIVYQYKPVLNGDGKPHHAAAVERADVLARLASLSAKSARAGFAPKPGEYFIAWDVRVATDGPRQR